jgi:hypothetical protein
MDEFPQTEEVVYEETYSAFWPLLVLMCGILIWIGFQVYSVNAQRIVLDQQFQLVAQQVVLAQNAKAKLYSVAQDLIQLSSKDTNAEAIVREANIRISGANGASGAETAAPAK